MGYFIDSIDLTNELILEDSLRGVQTFSADVEIEDKIKSLHEEYSGNFKKATELVGEANRKMLEEKGISGNAISTVMLHYGKEPLDDITAAFKNELAIIKRKIVE